MQLTKKFSWLSLVICLMLMVVLLPTLLFSQNDPRLEVIVMFEPGIVTVPKSETEATVNEVQIKSSQIKTAFLKHNVQFVSKAFPRFSPADTLGISRTGEQVRLAGLSNIFVLRTPDTATVKVLVNAIKKLPGVVYAEPNFHNYRAHGFPNDPHYENGDQWGLNNYGQNGGTNDADIDAPEAWQITTGSAVLIGVIDDGVDAGHEDLLNKVSGDAGVYGGNQYWHFGHGTHVAGIAAAIGNNDKGIAGVNWAATINSQRVENGSDTHFYNSIMDAVDAGSKILNNSWGGYEYSTTIRMAFANAYKLNVVSVASMGNDNTSSVSYPAGFGQGIISVGATNRNDVRWEWDQHNGSNYGAHIDVVAPGDQIWSTLPYTNQYQSWTGTSMAAPHVSGIASLMLSVNPSLYNDDIEQIIKISADDVNDPNDPTTGPGWDTGTGTGRVNAKKALDLIRSPNTVNHWTASGGSSVGNTGYYKMTFYSTPGLASGVYLVKRYDVRKTVTFPQSFESTPHVWGRGVATNGYSMANPNFGMGWCDVVSNNNTSATLKTYVYKVYNILGQYLGWYPCQPSQVTFAYTVLGIPAPLSVTISGPTHLNSGQTGTFTANPSGGSGSYTNYQWWYRNDEGDGPLEPLQGKNITPLAPPHGWWIYMSQWEGEKTITYGASFDFSLKCKVTDSDGNTATDIHSVIVGGLAKGISEQNTNAAFKAIPKEFTLSDNYPNPFNPTTTIKFGLPEEAHVEIFIYSITGERINTLLSENLPAGYHEVQWNGTDRIGNKAASGVYIYELKTDSKRLVKKMLLVK